MRRISLLIICFILASGCAHLKTMSAPNEENNFIDVPRLGIIPADNKDKLIVKKLMKNSPAELAGVQIGDILDSVDGNKLTKFEFLLYMNTKPIGQDVTLVINRNGTISTTNIMPIVGKAVPSTIKIDKLIQAKKTVSVAILVSQVKNAFPNVPPDWADSIKSNLQSSYEKDYLSRYDDIELFSIVDRSKLNHILDEYKFSQMGFVSEKLSVKIGEMTGATHIVDITFARHPAGSNSADDVTNARLIDIQSGKVLAVDTRTEHK